MYIYTAFKLISLPLHAVRFPLHFPLDKQVLAEDPIMSNPTSHLNLTMLGKNVLLPYIDPFIGTEREPQSIAIYI
jgi:hypothetical protein